MRVYLCVQENGGEFAVSKRRLINYKNLPNQNPGTAKLILRAADIYKAPHTHTHVQRWSRFTKE